MRWGIYALDGFEGSLCFERGVLAAGHEARRRSVNDWRGDCLEDFDVVAVFGLHHHGRSVLEAYQAQNVPVLVVDFGYLRRVNNVHDMRTGHWQVSLGGLNRPPAFDCPADRFEDLGLTIAESGGRPDGYALLCLQVPGDASHGLDSHALDAWARREFERWDRALVRPHPNEPDFDYGLPRCPLKRLDEALAGARIVVTGNSNVGNDALLAGVPAVATFPGASWAHLAGDLPSVDARLAHFQRLAYGQWTWAEFETGAPQRFIIERILQ